MYNIVPIANNNVLSTKTCFKRVDLMLRVLTKINIFFKKLYRLKQGNEQRKIQHVVTEQLIWLMKASKGRSWNMKTFHISEYSAEGLKIEGPHQLLAWEVLTTVYRALATGYFSDLRPLLPLSTSLPLSPICFRGKGKGNSGISLISKEYTKEAIIDHTSYKDS